MRETASAPDDAKRVTMQVSTVGIVCNAALTVFKLIAGIVAHSSAIVADAVHSASDILGSLIVMIGAVFSNKAADASHPYGHEKLECIASILLGNILVLVGAAIGYTGITKILHGETLAAPGMLALIAAAVSIAVKEALYWYTIAAAKRIRSVSLKAEAWHHRSDALSSIGSFAGVLGARLGLPILDPIASIVICLFIFKVAFGIFRESIDRLVDRAADADTIDTMRQQYAPEAERRVRTELTLKAIAAAENVTPTDDEISDKIDEFAKQAHQTPEEFKEKLTADDMEYIGDIVKLQKTVDMLKKEAKYIDKPAEEPKTEEKAEDKAE